jgi:hypothetical protein
LESVVNIDIANKFRKAAEKLHSKVQSITKHRKKGSLSSAINVWTKMSWNKKKIVQLEHDLPNYKNMMEIQLIPRIWYVPSNLNC